MVARIVLTRAAYTHRRIATELISVQEWYICAERWKLSLLQTALWKEKKLMYDICTAKLLLEFPRSNISSWITTPCFLIWNKVGKLIAECILCCWLRRWDWKKKKYDHCSISFCDLLPYTLFISQQKRPWAPCRLEMVKNVNCATRRRLAL